MYWDVTLPEGGQGGVQGEGEIDDSARLVLVETCRPTERTPSEKWGWGLEMDEEAERRR